jgi:multidrug resistance protein MdtO
LVFVAQIAILKYRLQLPGFELPVRVREELRDFDFQRAAVLEGIADRVEGKTPLHIEISGSSAGALEQTARESLPPESSQCHAGQLQNLLSLAKRANELVRVLQEEI